MSSIDNQAKALREQYPQFEKWAQGFGVVQHTAQTQLTVYNEIQYANISLETALPLLEAADRICNQAMWLVVHMTYAKQVKLNGDSLESKDFKNDPQGHTGGSLNMVPAYVGYLTANALTQDSREWVMGQGHCVAAIDSVNLLMDNALPLHQQCYPLTDSGLSRYVSDFYSYAINQKGSPASPVGSHVNVNTAGASLEGGYLGFAGLHYIHQSIPGEKLVAFLSDGAFEEQRGSDWAPRWWRAEDCGLVSPIMIANGRRIDQRTTAEQLGGVDYFARHLSLHNFAPDIFDGRDPVAFAVQILKQERLLQVASKLVKEGKSYPVKLPYGIADTEKGFGFFGAGTNAAHGTPLPSNPKHHDESRLLFQTSCQQLFVPENTWRQAADTLNNHGKNQRLKERDIALQQDLVKAKLVPFITPDIQGASSPMASLDKAFLEIVKNNPNLRPRIANPDELRSNRFNLSLDFLKHRVTAVENKEDEAIDGAVITALNEEAVISSALANRSGINIAISYEAFAAKMLGALRQKIIFSRHKKEAGVKTPWLSIPVIATSHVWENGKNEQSHQDPVFCEAMMGEMSDVSRVIFPADSASAVQYLAHCYESHGQIFSMVIPKGQVSNQFTQQQALQLSEQGAIKLSVNQEPRLSDALQIIAIGSYQLVQAQKIVSVLNQHKHACSLIYISEPGRFRQARDQWENDFTHSTQSINALFGEAKQRLFLCHGRPESFLGVLRPLDLGPKNTRALGYINRGGTLDSQGMLFANQCTWAHGLAAIMEMDAQYKNVLSQQQLNAVMGQGDPYCIIDKPA